MVVKYGVVVGVVVVTVGWWAVGFVVVTVGWWAVGFVVLAVGCWVVGVVVATVPRSVECEALAVPACWLWYGWGFWREEGCWR